MAEMFVYMPRMDYFYENDVCFSFNFRFNAQFGARRPIICPKATIELLAINISQVGERFSHFNAKRFAGVFILYPGSKLGMNIKSYNSKVRKRSYISNSGRFSGLHNER